MMDVYDLWDRRERERERKLARCPICSICEEPIQDEELIDYEGNLFHEHCFLAEYRKWTEDYT